MRSKMIEDFTELANEAFGKGYLGLAAKCGLLLIREKGHHDLMNSIIQKVESQRVIPKSQGGFELDEFKIRLENLFRKYKKIEMLDIDDELIWKMFTPKADPEEDSNDHYIQLLQSPDSTAADHVYEISDRAKEFYHKGDIEKALRGYKRVEGLNPDSLETKFNLTLCLMRLKRNDEALMKIKETLQCSGADIIPDVHYLKALTELYTENRAGALLSFRTALDLDKNYKKAQNEFDKIYREINRFSSSSSNTSNTTYRDSDISEFKNWEAFLFNDYELPTLNDFGGYPHLLAEAKRIKLLINNPEIQKKYGIYVPNCWIIEGPPGSGKSHFAKCLTGSLHFNLLDIPVQRVMDPYYGISERNLVAVFEYAFEHQPICMFFDELEILGGKRFSSQFTRIDDKMVNLFLSLISKYFDPNKMKDDKVFLMGTTNFIDNVDPAFKRPGRCQVFKLGYPNPIDLAHIMKVHIDRVQSRIDGGNGISRLFDERVIDALDYFLQSFGNETEMKEIWNKACQCSDVALHNLLKVIDVMLGARFTGDYVREVISQGTQKMMMYELENSMATAQIDFSTLQSITRKISEQKRLTDQQASCNEKV